eukprot:gene4302-6613_t
MTKLYTVHLFFEAHLFVLEDVASNQNSQQISATMSSKTTSNSNKMPHPPHPTTSTPQTT